MRNDTLDKLVWIFIYGGLLTLCLGLFVAREDAVFGGVLTALGIAAAAFGAVLVWLRSRRGP